MVSKGSGEDVADDCNVEEDDQQDGSDSDEDPKVTKRQCRRKRRVTKVAKVNIELFMRKAKELFESAEECFVVDEERPGSLLQTQAARMLDENFNHKISGLVCRVDAILGVLRGLRRNEYKFQNTIMLGVLSRVKKLQKILCDEKKNMATCTCRTYFK